MEKRQDETESESEPEVSNGCASEAGYNTETEKKKSGTESKKRKINYAHKFNEKLVQDYPWLSCKNGKSFCEVCTTLVAGSASHIKRHVNC
ncbi:hypothetical protein TcasGA2_TC031653 [Tribolium castaneum]|uniref:Uncharacterized protein n=1 Tax=Tribolium castaneum TaxID=7070 RepID=A0A139W9Y0_TRICA|nr:hypothetical protein TcasGA2_TC031653 [Tribolium castaneum]